ncbi:MAG: PilZ domain-containing protein, partial [Bryobacteraceae bacterium]|nr:PilZ domain-containing protein [Bryobacteraceae bacterium]
LIASLGTTILVFRAASRRIQLLALSVGLLALCQTVLLADRVVQNAGEGHASEGTLRLSAGALSLAVVLLLNRENKDRRKVDTRIRCYEPELAVPPDSGKLRSSTTSSELEGRVIPGAGGIVLAPPGHSNEASARPAKPVERRRSRRYRVCSVGDFRIAGGGEDYRGIDVQDLSRTGLCFMASEPAVIGVNVFVRLYGVRLNGVVVRCIPANGRYQYGVELNPYLRTGEVAEVLRQGLRETSPECGRRAPNGS